MLATLQERELLSGTQRLLVACSGGPDSQTLLHVLAALQPQHGCQLFAASVDHGLRADAQRDVALAAQLAEALGVPFLALRVEVAPGPSRQAQARAARYAALLACAREHAAQCIAVGHTLEDQAETVLARILRGTGLTGLAAITPKRADGVVRPLLDAPRALVRAYAAEHALACASDPSNADPHYLRTRIRQSLLPWLVAENPRVCEALAHLADDARDALEPLQRAADVLLTSASAAASEPGVEARAGAGEQGVEARAGAGEQGVEARAGAGERGIEARAGAGQRGIEAHTAAQATQAATRAPGPHGRVLAAARPAEQRRALKRWVERELGVELRRRHVLALQRMLWVGGEVRLPKGTTAVLDPAGRLTFSTVSKRSRGALRPTKEPKRGA